jgi:hypothetical protein
MISNGGKRVIAATLALFLAVDVACGGGGDGGGSADAAPDAGSGDSATAPAADGSGDAPAVVMTEDAGQDAQEDAGPGPSTDAAPDASSDAAPDATSDAAADAAADAPVDSSFDADMFFDAPCATSFVVSFPDASPLTQVTDAAVSGALLVAVPDGGEVFPTGLTADDYFVYQLGGAAVYAVPLDGGVAQTIIDPDGGPLAVLAVNGLDVIAQTASGDSYVWRAGAPAVEWQSAPDINDGYVVAVSADGSRAIVSDSMSGGEEAVYGVDLGTHDGTLLFQNCETPATCNCFQSARGAFSGDTAVLDACIDGTVSDTEIAGFAGSSWAKTTYVPSASLLPLWVANGSFFATTSGDALSLYSLAGSPAIPVDVGVQSGALTPDGSALVYLTGDGLLERSSTASPSPPTPLGCGFSSIAAVSPDGRLAALLSNGGWWFASTTAPDWYPMPIGGFAGFSADSSTAFLLPGGGLWSQPVDGGAPTLIISSGLGPLIPLSGGKILFGVDGATLLYEWDSAVGGPATPLTRLAGAYLAVSPSLTVAVFEGAQGAIYALTLP